MTDTLILEDERAAMSSAEQNDLPDSAFAYIEPGGKKDEEGKTVPRSLRHYPVHDEAHARNALSRASAAIAAGGQQADIAQKAMPKIKAAAKKFGIEVSDDSNDADEPSEERADCPTCKGSGTIMDGHRKCPDCNGTGTAESKAVRKPRHTRDLAPQTKCRREYGGRIEMRSGIKDASTGSDLVELTGRVIGYETPYEVNDMFGTFTEVIHRGACEDLLSRPDLDVCFLVGHDASVVPLARTGAKASLDLTEDNQGLQVRALIDPRMTGAQDLLVGIENGTISRMSVGMQVDHDVWSGEDANGFPNKRDIYRLAHVFDASAVAMPANPNTALELASARMEEFPPEVNARVQYLEKLAKRGSRGEINQADSDALLNVIRRLFTPDTERAAPTAQDANVSKAIVAAHKATSAAIASQMEDPDNNSDPVDKKVMSSLQDAHAALSAAMGHQAKDGMPDDPPAALMGEDGTQGGDGPNGSTSGDGTGTRAALRLELDMVKMRRAHG